MPLQRSGPHGLGSALLATALFRCWHLIVFFGAWAALWTSLDLLEIRRIGIQSTLLTVIGTVLGFVISYRTTSSFERYNEGRKYWSQIVLSSRSFARTIWFHVPDICPSPSPADAALPEEQQRARALIEKKTAINLIEAFAVAVKHYLRGEQGVFYEDLYPLVKSLPPYTLPAVVAPSEHTNGSTGSEGTAVASVTARERASSRSHSQSQSLPHPVTSPRRPTFSSVRSPIERKGGEDWLANPPLFPAYLPPARSLFDLFPFSLLAKFLTKRGNFVGGKKAARLRAKRGEGNTEGNVPLEITFYLSSYIATLQNRKLDVATINQLFNPLNSLVDALSGLERILTTPIPFSYSAHLWLTTFLYVGALPFQLVLYLGWITIPATVIASFMFFGFLVAGEEIENPFGYDKNDLDLDYFCQNIIRLELRALTSADVPDPADWAFSKLNNHVFDSGHVLLPSGKTENHATPEEWLKRGAKAMKLAMAKGFGDHLV